MLLVKNETRNPSGLHRVFPEHTLSDFFKALQAEEGENKIHVM